VHVEVVGKKSVHCCWLHASSDPLTVSILPAHGVRACWRVEGPLGRNGGGQTSPHKRKMERLGSTLLLDDMNEIGSKSNGTNVDTQTRLRRDGHVRDGERW